MIYSDKGRKADYLVGEADRGSLVIGEAASRVEERLVLAANKRAILLLGVVASASSFQIVGAEGKVSFGIEFYNLFGMRFLDACRTNTDKANFNFKRI